MTEATKLESSPLWKLVSQIADYAEELIMELPEIEEWSMKSKLRGRALDLTSDVAEAYGAIDPRDKKWLLGAARRSLFSVKNIIKVADRRQYMKIDPNIMVAIDKAIDRTDREIGEATKDIPKWLEEMGSPAGGKKK